MVNVHTISGYQPKGYFNQKNVDYIKSRVTYELSKDFKTLNGTPQRVIVDTESVLRIMNRVLEEQFQTIPLMNQRVVMMLCNEIRTHQLDVHKHLKWEENYIQSQRLYDATGQKGVDTAGIKLAHRLGKPCVGGTQRFVFM